MLKVAVVEVSYLLKKGMVHLLNQFEEVASVVEFSNCNELNEQVVDQKFNLLVLNTSFVQQGDVDLKLLEEQGVCKIVYLYNSSLPAGGGPNNLSIFDSKATLILKFEAIIKEVMQSELPGEENEGLSEREKLILKQVALGLTNKEIGTKLFISTHTVISHRKNITRKLGIKTVSGLTVYAILNNLIRMDEVS